MSSADWSGNIDPNYWWHAGLDAALYVIVTYRVRSVLPLEVAAQGMAREQSVVATCLPGYLERADLSHLTARVVSVDHRPARGKPTVRPFVLQTPVYAGRAASAKTSAGAVRIAYPMDLVQHSLAQLMNVIWGELPRLGFITALQMRDVRLPASSGWPGPRFGAQAIQAMLNAEGRPVLCRSARPAMGVPTDVQQRVVYDVLRHGFDVAKDDELTYVSGLDAYRAHVEAMVEACGAAARDAGRPKAYIANAIADASELWDRVQISRDAGATGVLLSPVIQGLSTLARVRRETGLWVLSHNTGSDHLLRHPDWGIDPAAWASLERMAGADLLVSPGDMARSSASVSSSHRRMIEAATQTNGRVPSAMPILMGGKNPQELARYDAAVGHRDYMLIVASWIDRHSGGLVAGARAFAAAVRQPVREFVSVSPQARDPVPV